MNQLPSQPLTEARIVRLLDALEEFGGDHMMFLAAANQLKFARMAGQAPAADPADTGDAEQMGDDLSRLQMMWMMAGPQLAERDAEGAYQVFARLSGAFAGDDDAAWDPEDEEEPSEASLLAGMVRLAGATSAPGTDNLFATFTREEMEAAAAHVDRIAYALAPERSGAMAEIEAQYEATRENSTRISSADPEAREWLRANGQEAPLAGNRFDAEDARAFVEELYAAGAKRVVISADSIRDDAYERSQGGPYADALKVELPRDPAQRAALFAISAREAEGEGFDPDEDTGQDVLFFWWD